MHETRRPIEMPIDEVKEMAAALGAELQAAARLSDDLRARFIHVRAALFQRGIYDPVLVRFDSATVTQASTAELASQLAKIAESL